VAKGGKLQRWYEKHIINPVMRLALRARVTPRAIALIETTGRVSGQSRQTPVGIGLDGRTAWLVAEHGSSCDYVKNLLSDPKVRVKFRQRWYSGTASVVDDDDARARRRAINKSNGFFGWLDGYIFTLSATTPCTVRIDLDS
jgi:deazaflavin-dependent oxidoreductase (nitroreductase family)